MKFIHRLHISILGFTLAFAGQLLGQGSSANSTVLMTVTGKKQGQIDGEVTPAESPCPAAEAQVTPPETSFEASR